MRKVYIPQKIQVSPLYNVQSSSASGIVLKTGKAFLSIESLNIEAIQTVSDGDGGYIVDWSLRFGMVSNNPVSHFLYNTPILAQFTDSDGTLVCLGSLKHPLIMKTASRNTNEHRLEFYTQCKLSDNQ